MKFKFTYLLIASLLLPGCQKETPVDPLAASGSAIQFNTPTIKVEPTTRWSGPTDLFPSGHSFGVLGYCLANYAGTSELDPSTGSTSWEAKAVLSSPHIFYKREVKYNGTTCYYTGQQEMWYEPQNYLYTFFAYYPYGDTYYTVEPSTQSGIGTPSLTFNMPFEGGSTSTQRNIADIPDAMAAASVDVTRQAGNVQLQFEHLLAGVNFQINNYNTTHDLTIHGLSISGNFYRSIKIILGQHQEYPSDTFAGVFSFVDSNSDTDDITIAALNSAEKVGNNTLMLISNLGAAPNYFGTSIDIHIDYTFMGARIPDKIVSLPAKYLPQGGTIYTVTMNFIGDAFVLDFVVDNNQIWEEGGESEIQFD